MRIVRVLLVVSSLFFTAVQAQWKMQNVPVQTRWAKDVSPSNVLPEYPRPQMVRSNWVNLNGLWDYAITAKDAAQPTAWEGKILVPYPIESALSGVKKVLQPTEHLWYMRRFNKPQMNTTDKVLLHFGAVDYEATVYINGKKVGNHSGGYNDFSFDVTPYLTSTENILTLQVYDPSDKGVGPHGKQVLNPQGIYYTPSSGIWQTVWIEVVPASYITSLTITPDIDKSIVSVKVNAATATPVTLVVDGKTIKGKANSIITVPVKNAKLWSPATPNLYDLKVTMGKDEVSSYFGMRKISIGKDEKGFDRIFLNNKPCFNLGTLDQGFWPDGLYTAPTDEALAFDIKVIKAMGFNTIRKHIKVEPARWYYHADKLGILVWQDFVNPNQSLPEGSKAAFEKGVQETINELYNFPCVVAYTIFNEKWGQYDQQRITEWVKKSDPTRIINGHSGEFLYVNEKLRSPSPNAYVSADMTDVHSYPDPMNAIQMPGKARVLGEFGGIGVFVPHHQWLTGSAWGYIQEKPAALKLKYQVMNQNLALLEKEGLSASIYTQPFDVEGEQNGLLTYDREVVKIPLEEMRKIHASLNPDMGAIPEVTAGNLDPTDPVELYSHALQQYTDGKRDILFIKELAMMAGQAGDAAGKFRFSSEYIASFSKPYNQEAWSFIESTTKKVTDPGFSALLEKEVTLQGAERMALHNSLLNMIYNDFASYVSNPRARPDWNEIELRVKPYGAIGEEIYLRAKAIYFLNQQDWASFKPAAKAYLEKYSSFIKEQDKKFFQDAIDKNK